MTFLDSLELSLTVSCLILKNRILLSLKTSLGGYRRISMISAFPLIIFLRYQCCVMQIILSTFPGAMTVLLMCVTLRKHLEILATMCFVLTESRHRRIGIRGSILFIIYRLVSMQSGMKI